MDGFRLYEQNAGLILAAEDWANIYRKDEASFAQLVKGEAKMQTELIKYFKGFSDRALQLIDWYSYNNKLREIHASDEFQVDVMVQEIPDSEDSLIMQIVYEPLVLAVEAGLLSAEANYKFSIPDETIAQAVSQVAKEKIAYLVGRRVDRDGNIVPAKNPQYHINQVTRDRIKDSIRTSLSLGEDQKAASERIANIVKDPKRAERIASTEAVNAFQGGQYRYALEAGATGKEWQALASACVKCKTNADAGIIPIDQEFPSGHQAPSCHPFDRCGLRYDFGE